MIMMIMMMMMMILISCGFDVSNTSLRGGCLPEKNIVISRNFNFFHKKEISSFYQIISDVACTRCAAGLYCPARSESVLLCPDGYYAAAGSYSDTSCPASRYCTTPVQ